MNNSIHLAGGYRKIQSRVLATGNAPYPGMLLQENSSGQMELHSAAGGSAERIVVLEDALQGKTVSDIYTAGTVVDCAVMIPGSESQVLLAAGQNVSIGNKLMSAGNGKFTKLTSTNVPLCVVTEALDLSESGAVDTLVKVRWM